MTIRLAIDEGAVGIGGSGARYVTSTDGSRWIAKTHVFGSHRCLCMNEGVCAQIAQRIELRTPEAAVLELEPEQLEGLHPGAAETDRFFFASRLIDGAESLSPTAAGGADPGQLAGIAVLDSLVHNTDQKPEHLLALQEEDGSWGVQPIDYGHALAVGDSVGSFDPQAGAHPVQALLQPHISWEDVGPWLKRVQEISRQEFRAMVDGLPAAWVFEPDASATLADALVERVRRLPDLLQPQFPE
jgi:HipA-like kinase